MTDGAHDTDLPAASVTRPIPPKPAPSRPETRWLGRIGAWVFVALIIALVVVGSLPYWAPQLEDWLPWGKGASDHGRVVALQAELQRTTQDRDAALQRAAAAAQPVATPAPLPAPDTTALTARINALENRPPPAATTDTAALASLNQELGGLTTRLDTIEARLDKMAANSATLHGDADRMLLVAILELRGAIASSRPYSGELAAVEALAANQPELSASWHQLEATAASGIPSVAALDERFTAETAPAILRAKASAPAEESWIDQMLARVKGLVVIHRTGSAAAAGDDPAAAAVAAAQATLDKGDLAGAVAALGNLGGTPAQAASAWLGSARQRLAAETTLADATQRVAKRLAQAAATPAVAASPIAAPATTTDEQH